MKPWRSGRTLVAELKKHKYLLSIAIILFTIKFVVIPWQDWQSQLIESNNLMATKLNKINSLLINKVEFKSTAADLSALLDKVEGFYFKQSSNQLKLELQKQLEEKIKNHNIELSSLGWQNSFKIPDSAVTKHQAELSFSGQTIDVIKFLLALNQMPQVIGIETFNFNLLRQRAGTLGRVTVRIRIAVLQLEEIKRE